MDYEALERKAYIEGSVERATLYALLDDQQRDLVEGSYEEGRFRGYEAGYGTGFNEGYEQGNDAGYDEGYSRGYDEGRVCGKR